ncbi:MAG: HAMP domain-containing protein [Proteobacteria bacterium]|nr:HAMP domain-containing protein [Pseudomonadota bacterium]
MSRLWHLLRLDRVTIQIALVVLVGGIVSAAVISVFLVVLRPEHEPPEIRETVGEIASIARVLDGMPRADRPRVATLYQRDDIRIALDAAASRLPAAEPDNPLLSSLLRTLPEGVTVAAVGRPEGQGPEVVLRLGDGQYVAVRRNLGGPLGLGLGPGLPLPPPFSSLGLSLIVLVALTVALSIWAVLRIVTPLARFATAVEQFGLRGEGGPLREEGTAEVRKATNAFNRMRERIQRLIEDRTRMMIAISHDLRTPLTRLRLRAEEIAEPALKQGMLRDMDLMERSIAGAVSYLREGGVMEETEMADLPSLIETICDQFTDAGFAVGYEGPQRLAVRLRPQAIARAVTNLVENGTKYGSTVIVRLGVHDRRFAEIDVEDDGPGVPDSEKEAVLQPFYRTSAARESVGGFGLGLAITADVARLHGGSLTLHDRTPHGLCARLRLPLDDASAGAGR